jgi:mRNA-degrading endonuclease RelE of RelBE toxin-antitoxin system
MLIIRTADFERSLQKLPVRIRVQCEHQFALFQSDQRDSRLHIKKLHEPHKGIYSFRVTREYRALFYFDIAGRVIVFDVDNRKDVYR